MPDAGDCKARVALVNLGCRVNRVELDMMALALQERGCSLVGQRDADVIVVNTCAVTGEAQAKTRKAIRHAAGLPQRPLVVATGCVANLFADELAAIGGNVVVEALKAQVPERVIEVWDELSASRVAVPAGDGVPSSVLQRTTPTGRTRPGIKIQDGCDNRCSFCIVWKARGRSRSLALDEVLDAVRAAQNRGAQEVVLTGINLGNYRATTPDGGRIALPGLLDAILAQTDVGRVRLSSIEPPDVDDALLSVMAEAGERVAPFLHVCLQAGCDRTLAGMRRVYDTAQFARMAERAYEALPGLALGTDLIVGFPGERDEDFEESYAFCERMRFARMHIFRYSKRPGTPAAARKDQVPPNVAASRSDRMHALAARMRHEQAARHVGLDELVVVQDRGKGVSGGLFDVLVDESLPLDALVRVRVREVLPDGTLVVRDS